MVGQESKNDLSQFILIVFYPVGVSHPIEPRGFVMFSNMTCNCNCPLVWLGLAFESSTLSHFFEKPRSSTGWESG